MHYVIIRLRDKILRKNSRDLSHPRRQKKTRDCPQKSQVFRSFPRRTISRFTFLEKHTSRDFKKHMMGFMVSGSRMLWAHTLLFLLFPSFPPFLWYYPPFSPLFPPIVYLPLPMLHNRLLLINNTTTYYSNITYYYNRLFFLII